MFKTRLLSGIILVLLALFVIGTGNDLLFFVTMLVSLVGLYEIYKIFEIEKKMLGMIGYLAGILYYILLRFDRENDVTMLFLGFLVLLMAAYVITFPKYMAEQAMASFFSVFYVAIMLSFVYQTRMLDNGLYLVWLIFLCSWGCDTCAYCVGMLIGKHKLAPKLSPKKSIEGAIGGVVGAALLGFVYASIFKGKMELANSSVYIIAGICALGAVISQIGDLAASGIKRNHDIKDYGKIIPGHGGVLDRFDSVIFTAPIIYYLSALWIVNV